MSMLPECLTVMSMPMLMLFTNPPNSVGVDVLDADGLDDPKPNRRSIGPSSLSVVLAGPLTAPIPSNTVEVNRAPMMRDLMSMCFISPNPTDTPPDLGGFSQGLIEVAVTEAYKDG